MRKLFPGPKKGQILEFAPVLAALKLPRE